MEHTDRYRHLHRPYVRILLTGLLIGAVAQMASQTSQYQARLVSDFATPYRYDSRHQTVKLIVLKKTLVASAARDNMLFMLDKQQPVLHAAAPAIRSASSRSIVSNQRPVVLSLRNVAIAEPQTTSSSSSFVITTEASASSAAQESDVFPPFIRTLWPINKAPNWGAMRTPTEWSRTYDQMQPGDFVPIPSYDMSVLTTPMTELSQNMTPDNIAKITTKLFYSTRFFGAYDLDSGEFSSTHPAVDLKLARGTPIGAIAGGLVIGVRRDESGLGLHVLIEHHLPDGKKYISIYGHLDDTPLHEGDVVTPGQFVGHVGMTGNTTAPHLHLQVDLDDGTNPHQVYAPLSIPSPSEAAKHVINPITFIETYFNGVR